MVKPNVVGQVSFHLLVAGVAPQVDALDLQRTEEAAIAALPQQFSGRKSWARFDVAGARPGSRTCSTGDHCPSSAAPLFRLSACSGRLQHSKFQGLRHARCITEPRKSLAGRRFAISFVEGAAAARHRNRHVIPAAAGASVLRDSDRPAPAVLRAFQPRL